MGLHSYEINEARTLVGHENFTEVEENHGFPEWEAAAAGAAYGGGEQQ